MLEIELTRHCVERYHERFKPALDLIRAREDLEALVTVHAAVEAELPPWAADRIVEESEAYLIVGEDLVIPVARVGPDGDRLIAKTCIGRGGISERTRARRNQRARRRRAERGRHRRTGHRRRRR